MSITFQCDLSGETTPLPHFWEHTVGSGHAPLALRADWQANLKKSHEELGFGHVRFHGLLSSPMDTLMIEDDKPLYSFFNADQIIDFLRSIQMRPFVELSFMPTALASGNQTVFQYQANVTPPKNYADWATLIRTLVSHFIERYGIEEVREWFFEVWNEPNESGFWTGTQAEYFKLYEFTARAIKEVDSLLQVGGPVTADNAWIDDFVAFCEKSKAPNDFISTHHYPTDAFGKPGDDTVQQLAASKRGILREEAREVVRQAKGKPVYYTEWSSSSNPRDALHDEPYAAAFITKTILEANGLVKAYSYWTFSDIFEENYFPSTPFQGGFGLMNIHGIPKPAYRAYELLHAVGEELLQVDGEHNTVDAWAVKKNPKSFTVLVTNYGLPEHPIETEQVQIALKSASGYHTATVRRIDKLHANPKKAWEELGAPKYPNRKEVERLHEASRLVQEQIATTQAGGTITMKISMPPLSVAAILVEFT